MNIELILIRLPALLLSLTVHEYMHGLVAYWKGDTTARDAGRLTFNPVPHIDPLGLIMILWGPFGWAKPVPVNPNNLKQPRTDLILVSVAGPLSNIVLAFIVGIIITVISSSFPGIWHDRYIQMFLQNLFLINAILPVFNLLPVPPLDGSKILMGIIPQSKVALYYTIARYASRILFVFLISDWIYSRFQIGLPLFSYLIWPLLYPYLGLWSLIFGPQVF